MDAQWVADAPEKELSALFNALVGKPSPISKNDVARRSAMTKIKQKGQGR
jgi:hypothetical protein